MLMRACVESMFSVMLLKVVDVIAQLQLQYICAPLDPMHAPPPFHQLAPQTFPLWITSLMCFDNRSTNLLARSCLCMCSVILEYT